VFPVKQPLFPIDAKRDRRRFLETKTKENFRIKKIQHIKKSTYYMFKFKIDLANSGRDIVIGSLEYISILSYFIT